MVSFIVPFVARLLKEKSVCRFRIALMVKEKGYAARADVGRKK